MAIETGDTVSIEYVGRLDDGTVFDTSRESVATEHGLEHHPEREYEPLTVEVGAGEIIQGLEDGLLGLDEGEEATVSIPPEDGYGQHTEDRVVAYDTDEFTAMIGGRAPEEGTEVQTEEGLPGEVVAVDDDTVTVDFNHELAGETLEFAVEVVSVE
ncbi:MAG: peptidylprolyl isomerase [Haloarculaceae archaeon]